MRKAKRLSMQLAGLSGPLNCAAPELAAAVVGLGPPVAAGRAVDMWGLGILLLELLTARPLFEPSSCDTAAVARLTQEMIDRRLAAVPSEAADMLRQLLQIDPARRPTAEQLLGKGGGRLQPHRFVCSAIRGRGTARDKSWMALD